MKVKQIKLKPFGWKVKYVYCKDIQKAVNKFKLPLNVGDTTQAYSVTDSTNFIFYVFICKRYNTNYHLVHEVNHIVLDLFEWLENNPVHVQEVFCYYSDYLFNIGEKFYSKFK